METKEHTIDIIKQIFYKGLDAVRPDKAIGNYVKRDGDYLYLAEDVINLNDINRIFITGFGKASGLLAKGIEDILGNLIYKGFVIVKDGYKVDTRYITIKQASHPLPDNRTLSNTKILLDTVSKLTERDLVINLISGGGSSLFEYLNEGISLQDLKELNRLLLLSGLDIEKINIIRKKISKVKGGKFLKYLYPAKVYSLILSDVPGDKLPFIASGTTVKDNTTIMQAIDILKAYKIFDKVPESIKKYLLNAKDEKLSYKYFENVKNIIIGSNYLAVRECKKYAESKGYNTLILTSQIQGRVEDLSLFISSITRDINYKQLLTCKPACIILGGETTLEVKGNGSGGRAMHLALEVLNYLKDEFNYIFLAGATDGTDGPTDSAGAIISQQLYKNIKVNGLDIQDYIKNYDSYNFFKKTNSLLITGPTNTNVNDIYIMIVE